MQPSWRSRLRLIAVASALSIGAAGSAWATPVAYNVTFSCVGFACGGAAPSLNLTVNGTSVLFSGSVFGQKLTSGVFTTTPGNPLLVTGVANSLGGSLRLAGGIYSGTAGAYGSTSRGTGIWIANLKTGPTVEGFFKIAPPAIPEPGAALAFAIGMVVVGWRLRARA
jgi:hypothetical protein